MTYIIFLFQQKINLVVRGVSGFYLHPQRSVSSKNQYEKGLFGLWHCIELYCILDSSIISIEMEEI